MGYSEVSIRGYTTSRAIFVSVSSALLRIEASTATPVTVEPSQPCVPARHSSFEKEPWLLCPDEALVGGY